MKMNEFREGYLEEKYHIQEKKKYTKASREERSRNIFINRLNKYTKRICKSQPKPINMFLIPHELRFEHALMNTKSLKIANNIVKNDWEKVICNNPLKYCDKRILDSKLITSLKQLNWTSKRDKEKRFATIIKIINNRKDIVIGESEWALEYGLSLLNGDEWNLINDDYSLFVFDTNERICNLVKASTRLNNQTKKLLQAKERLDKRVKAIGVETREQFEKLESINKNWLILNNINNKLHEKEWRLDYKIDPLLDSLMKKQNNEDSEVEKKLTRKQKKNKKYREHLKKIGYKNKNQRKKIKGVMRAIEHNVLYKDGIVDLKKLNEELKKLQ